MSATIVRVLLVAGVLMLVAGIDARPQPGPPPAAVVPAAGMLLVARRELLSPGFTQSVVLLLRHNARGTFGVVINRRTRFRVQDLLPELEGGGAARHAVFVGGPVAPHALVMVMRREKPRTGIEAVTDDIAFSAEYEVLEALIARNKPVADLRLYIGYAGWAAGQLDAELARGSWFLVKATTDAVFADDDEDLWERLIDRLDPPGIRVHQPWSGLQAASGSPGVRSRPKAASASARSAARSSTGAG